MSLSILAYPAKSMAFGLDLLGDITKPLFGQDKENSVLKYVWVQPYAGYAFGSYRLTEATAGSLSAVSNGGLGMEGFMFGARGGLELWKNFRIGADFTRQFGDRELPRAGALGRQKRNSIASMLGAGVGFDFPHTPLQVFGARYFRADLQNDLPTQGDGWGAGISFVLINPFILLAEYRWLEYLSDPEPSGRQTQFNTRQFYLGLSFLLL